jgi:hypothetical protein
LPPYGKAEPVDRQRIGDNGSFQVQIQAAVQLWTILSVDHPRAGPMGLDLELATGVISDSGVENIPI